MTQEPPRLADCNGLLAYLDQRGSDAAHIIRPHLESSNPRARFFALYFLNAHGDASDAQIEERNIMFKERVEYFANVEEFEANFFDEFE